MAYHIEQTEQGNEIVWDGFETGIAASPHKGIGNMQAVNINTELGEVMCSYSRTKQTQTALTSGVGALSRGGTSVLIVNEGITGGVDILAGGWISITNSSITGLSNGTYYVISKNGGQSTQIQLSTTYSISSSDIVTGFSGAGTADVTLLYPMQGAVQGATERYVDTTGATQHRYYVLDTNGRVWMHDTATYSGLDTPNWALPYTGTLTSLNGSVTTTAGGMAVYNGWVYIFGGNRMFTVSTSQLGATPQPYPSSTAGSLMSAPATSNSHKAFSSRQGRLYYPDGRYVGSIFADISIDPDAVEAGLTLVNTQSYCSYTASTTTGTITAVLNGSIPTDDPHASAPNRVPAFFFPAFGGTQPTNLTAGVKYYIEYTMATYGTFNVYDFPRSGTATATGAFAGGETSATLTANWAYTSGTYITTFSNGDQRNATYTNGSTSVTWSGGLSAAATATLTLGSVAINIATGAAGTQYFNTFFPQSTSGDGTITFTPLNLTLPAFEIATALAELGNTIIVGTESNYLYPWNQIDATPSDLLPMPESYTSWLITVNNVIYIGSGFRGNVYITNASSVSLALTVPDYTTGLIEPYFIWGDAMFLRGRVYFSIQDQTSSHTGQCGGVWSFVPAQNFYIGEDIGLSLRMDNKNSYGTFNGKVTVLIPSANQQAQSPQYWSAWTSSVSSATYGIDFSDTVPSTAAVVQTDIVPTGTLLNKKTFEQLEYKLSAPLKAGESVALAYRTNLSAAFASAGTVIAESTTELSGYVPVNFENTQWLQLQATLTPDGTSTSSFVRLTQLRAR